MAEQRGRHAARAGQELPPADAQLLARLVGQLVEPRLDPLLLRRSAAPACTRRWRSSASGTGERSGSATSARSHLATCSSSSSPWSSSQTRPTSFHFSVAMLFSRCALEHPWTPPNYVICNQAFGQPQAGDTNVRYQSICLRKSGKACSRSTWSGAELPAKESTWKRPLPGFAEDLRSHRPPAQHRLAASVSIAEAGSRPFRWCWRTCRERSPCA